MLRAVAGALAGIRGAKSQAKASMRTELVRATVSGPAHLVGLAEQASEDLRAAGRITGELKFLTREGGGAEITVDAELAPADS